MSKGKLADLPPDPLHYEATRGFAGEAPRPATVGRVRAGTAGWTDPTLIASGRFYPKKSLPASDRLHFYASHFDLVEVDATYYSLLPPETSACWTETAPPGFLFDVKAFPVLTGHPIEVARLPGDLKEGLRAVTDRPRVYADRLPAELREEIEARFFEFLSPLAEAGRLGCLMLQFPPWFHATRGNARRIEELAERCEGLPLAVEFRHPSWLEGERRQRVADLLTRLSISYVAVDEPDVPGGGVPAELLVTSPRLAVVRFHGHNAAGWRKKGASVHERFNYLYGPEELSRWAAPVRRLADRAEAVHVVFNNCVRDYAVLDAKGLAVALIENGDISPHGTAAAKEVAGPGGVTSS